MPTKVITIKIDRINNEKGCIEIFAEEIERIL
jgi:hypothetical protein